MRLFLRPQAVTLPMVALALIIPVYLYIGATVHDRTLHMPEVALDRMVPVDPAWAPVYLSLFLAALLPVFVIHQQELIRRTVLAYLAAWIVSYVFFVAYPTIGPRPATVAGDGFLPWMLRSIWASDVRYNCFPSLHVAQSFLAALACYRVNRGVGAVAGVWATFVGVSTMYTKQHYFLDVVSGALLAYVAYLVFIRAYPRETTPDLERRLAPWLAVGAVGAYGIMVGAMWVAYVNGVVI